jgi:hypothetical protein
MEIININNINEININIEENDNSMNIIKITFDKKSVEIFENFIFENINQKYIYIKDNYKLNIDLLEYNCELYLFLIDCIEIANDKINISKYNYLIKPNNIWNLCVCDNIMFNFPFTLYNYIYIPIEYIKKCYKYNESFKLITTLIHEKIHIGQRFLEIDWEEFIKSQNNKWIKIDENNNIYKVINNKIIKTNNLINNDENELIIKS